MLPSSVKAFLLLATEAIVVGAMELLRGGSMDDALMKAQEELATARAKAKFGDLKA